MISSSTIKTIKSLQKKKHRLEHGLFVTEGQKLVEEILNSSLIISHIYHTDEWLPVGTINIQTTCVSAKEMKRISGLVTPTTVLAIVKIPQYVQFTSDFKGKLSLALENIQDPGNLGTIIRLANWFGIDTIFCSNNTTDAYSPKVVQATMGALTRVKVIYTDLTELVTKASNIGFPTFGTFLSGDNVYECNLPSEGIVVFGNEGKGISKELSCFVSQKLTIPSFSKNLSGSESLNVAMAATIVCSEFKRRVRN